MFKGTLGLAVLAQAANASLGFEEFMKMAWCDFGGMYGFKTAACGTEHPWMTMIPAGQRTQNSAGYSLDAKMWAQNVEGYSADMIYVQLRLMSPKLTSGEVVEVSFSIRDPSSDPTADANASTVSYDSLVCATQFRTTDTIDNYVWESRDIYGTTAQLPYVTGGAFKTAYNNLVDTKTGGTDDWIIDAGLSKNECTDTMCTWTCSAFKPLLTGDSKDI